MKNDDLQPLIVHQGDPILASRENSLVAAVRRRKIIGGPGVRVKQFDDQVFVSYRSKPTPSAILPFTPSKTTTSDGKDALKFTRGLVNGIEPQIEGNAISDRACAPLEIPGYGDSGDCLVYLQLTLDIRTWIISDATVIASATKPDWKPFTALKLLAIVNQTSGISQIQRFNLSFASSNHKSTGLFTSWWWAVG